MREHPSRRYALVVVSVFAVALAARLAPLHWSPLPATLDGFRYATLARVSLETARTPLSVIDADEFGFTNGLALVSAVTGVRPLYAAQPFVATVGAGAPLVGVALARRLGLGAGIDARRVYLAATLAGLGLALEGLFVRRTGVPDEEAIGLLLVPLLALAAHRWLQSDRPAWGVVTGAVLVVLPLVHNMSSILGALSVTAVCAVHAAGTRRVRTAARSLVLAGTAWTYFLGYFEVAERVGLRITYSGLLRPYPGLFLAWVIVLGVGVVWLRTRTERAGRASLLAVGGLWFLLLGVNAVTPLFPGTVPTRPAVVVLVSAFLVPTVLVVVGLPAVRGGSGPAVLAALLAPVALVFYLLSAALTPEFFGAVIRVQGFAHLPAFVLAGVGAAAVGARVPRGRVDATSRRWLVPVVVGLFLASVLLTVPLGYVNLDTGTYPSTTFESELAAVSFATDHVNGTYATDHTLSNVDVHYVRGPSTLAESLSTGAGAVAPTRSWLSGGPPPDCPVLVQRSWRTTGVHLYPAEPATLPDETFRSVLERRDVVYTASGHDPLWLAMPTADGTSSPTSMRSSATTASSGARSGCGSAVPRQA